MKKYTNSFYLSKSYSCTTRAYIYGGSVTHGVFNFTSEEFTTNKMPALTQPFLRHATAHESKGFLNNYLYF